MFAKFQQGLFQQLWPEVWLNRGLSPLNRVICLTIVSSIGFSILSTEPTIYDAAPELFEWVENIFALLFAIEYVARLYAAGEDLRYAGFLGRLRYMVTPLALLDLLATAPLFLSFLSADTLLVRICRLLRVIRFAKLGRYSTALRAMQTAVSSRRYELSMSAAVALVALIVSSTLMYLVEGGDQPETFGSIPRALWWSIATLTTVGYGDAVPMTVMGRILAGLTAVAAIGLIAMPTGILAAAFSEAFQKSRRIAPRTPPK